MNLKEYYQPANKQRSIFGSKLGLSLLAPYLTISFLTLLIIFGLIYYAYLNELDSNGKIQEEVSLKGSVEIDNYLRNIINEIDLVRNIIVCIECTDEHEYAHNQSIIKKLSEGDPSIYSVSLISRSGIEVQKFDKYKAGGSLALQDVSGEGIFGEIIEGGGRYVGPVYISEYELPAIRIGLPIIDLSNEIIGILSAEIDLSPMWEATSKIRVGETGYAYVVDSVGRLIAYKDISLVKDNTSRRDVLGVKNFFANKSASEFYKSFNGETVFGTWQPIDITGWGLIAELPRKEILINLLPLLGVGGFSFLLFLVLILIILRIVYVKLLAPIGLLAEGVMSIRGGDLAYRVPLKLDNELGDLAESFNDTAEDLQQNKKVLENAFRDLSEEHARLIASINSLSSSFVIVSVAGLVVISNKAAQKLFASDALDITFSKMEEKFKGSLDLGNIFTRVIETRKAFVSEDVAFDNNFFKVVLSPILIEGKDTESALGLVVAIEDITGHKRLELAQEEFLAIASHEMRTPLAVIRGNAEMLLKPKLEENEKNMLGDIIDSSIDLLDIVNDFLDVTALERKNISFIKESFDLGKVVELAILELDSRAKKKNLSLVLAPLVQLPQVLGDRIRIKEVLINLISNAIQYTEKGVITVGIAQADSFLKVTVSDTGVGIPLSSQSSMFQKFHTIGKQFLHSKEYGSGLGLYISRMIVEAMGGTIALEKSEPHVGSTFSFTIPLVSG